MNAGPALLGAKCGTHPEVGAVDVCSRCGAFLCADCVDFTPDELAACSACVERLLAERPTGRARLSVTLSLFALVALLVGVFVEGRPGLVSWGVGLPAGVLGLAFALQQLRLVRTGKVRGRAKQLAWAGLALGVLVAIGYGVLLAGFLLFFSRWRGA